MKRGFVTRLLSLSLAATMALSQGVTSYASNLSDESSAVASSIESAEEGDAASKETSDDLGEENTDVPGTGSELGDETESEENENENDSNDDSNLGASDAADSASSDEESASDASSMASSDDASSLASSAETDDKVVKDADYTPSKFEMEMKEKLIEHDSFTSFGTLKEGVDYVTEEVIALAESKEKAQEIAEIYDGKLVDYDLGVAVISLADSSLGVAEAFKLALDPELDYPFIEPNYYTEIIEPLTEEFDGRDMDYNALGKSDVPTGNGFVDRWWNDKYQDPYLNQYNNPYQWHHKMINSYSAWGVTTGNKNIVVGIIDSGVNISHEDLDGNIVPTGQRYEVISGAGYSDSVGHGTHVAGIIAAELNNKYGAGVAPNVSILPLKVAKAGDTTGRFESEAIYKALIYAGNLIYTSSGYVPNGTRRADIVNMSLGGGYYKAQFEAVLEGVYKAGVTAVVAMGNDSSAHMCYPATYPHVIAVCAVDEAGTLSDYSNYGSWADVAAPGSHIYSTYHKNNTGYVYMDGTSMACPVVAGACALYMSAYGHVDPDTMEQVIKSSTSRSAGAGAGKGIIDLAKMFGGDTTAPEIEMVSGRKEMIAQVQDGKAMNVTYDVALDAVLSFIPHNFDGTAASNKNTVIVYTTDGSTPAVDNGNVVKGTALAKNSSGVNNTLTVKNIVGDITAKKKVTVKAMAVTGMGVSSKVSSLTFTVDPELAVGNKDEDMATVKVKITNAPEALIAGKSIKLEAEVLNTADNSKFSSQAVTWKIEKVKSGNLSKAKMATNGTLTTDANQTGELVVSATTADTRVTSSVTIHIIKDSPVKTLTINDGKNMALEFKYSGTTVTAPTATIAITNLVNMDGKTSSAAKNFPTNKDFQWTSSKPDVVQITADAGNGKITVKGLLVGSSVITCKALDGSNKSAKITVTVSSSKKVASIKAVSYNDRNNAGAAAATAITMAVGDPALSLASIQLYADGTKGYMAPTWTTSNAKIVKVEGSGATAKLTAVAKGTANVVCTALDGSNKKATIKVTVVQKSTAVTVTGPKYIAEGTAGTFKADVAPATANNKTVNWEINPNTNDAKLKKQILENVTVVNGKVSVKKGYTYTGKIVVKATAADSGKSGSATFEIKPRVKALTAVVKKDTLATVAVSGKYDKQTTVEATTDNGTLVAFTSSNEKIVTVKTVSGNKATIEAVGKGAATITATAQDGSGKKATVKVNVLQLVDSVTVTGQPQIAVGANAKFTAAVLPATANNKNVEWSVIDTATNREPKGVTVKNGTVTVAKDAKVNTKVQVRAKSLDGGTPKYSYATFTVTDVKAGTVSLRISGTNLQKVYEPKFDKNDGLTSVRLFNGNLAENNSNAENQIVLKNIITGVVDKKNVNLTGRVGVVWASSAPGIVSVTANSNGTATVTALKAGKANITCTAQDGSGKKASVAVNVIVPASGIEVTAAKGLVTLDEGYATLLSDGKAGTAIATIGNLYGKPSVSGVKWGYELGFYQPSSDGSSKGTFTKLPDVAQQELIKNKVPFFTFANGKVTANKAAVVNKGIEYCRKYYSKYVNGNPAVRVIATTTDGTEYSGNHVFSMVNTTSYLNMYFVDYNNPYRLSTLKGSLTVPSSFIGGDLSFQYGDKWYSYIMLSTNCKVPEFNVNSSNPKVASATVQYNNGRWELAVFPHAKGSTTLTVQTLDGSGQKVSLGITVK